MKKEKKCLNCDAPAKKAGMCIACYTKNYRERQPEAQSHRQAKWKRERQRLSRDLYGFLHRLDNLNDKNCFSDKSLAAEFKLMAWKFFNELKAEDEPGGLKFGT